MRVLLGSTIASFIPIATLKNPQQFLGCNCFAMGSVPSFSTNMRMLLHARHSPRLLSQIDICCTILELWFVYQHQWRSAVSGKGLIAGAIAGAMPQRCYMRLTEITLVRISPEKCKVKPVYGLANPRNAQSRVRLPCRDDDVLFWLCALHCRCSVAVAVEIIGKQLVCLYITGSMEQSAYSSQRQEKPVLFGLN
ncbi:hypothetical protein BKA67DRAFT_17194 [Truncatella angustata]|uniref:Uncharacterized protein n=1 Tax=Truncatella angustata TaxID=152316 RepID=A0A9P9A1H5_9PEZI|nr:uncharacterized protein BKA67DRAFT_17194 [Truncatella angustata]KAH6659536.1 hypothetical protein BKA67DRAFT_17194 [Truncatella angustata]